VLVCVDGLSSYVGAITRAFSERVRSGKRGWPPRVCSPGLLLAQVVKTAVKRRVVQVSRRIVRGSPEAVAQVLTTASGGQHQINTASSERLNATVRAALAPLARRTRALVHREAVPSRGYVSGGHGLQLCLVSREPAPAYPRAGATLAGPHPPGGRRAHRPPLDHGRGATLPDAARALGPSTSAQASWLASQSPSGGGCRMITLTYGGTLRSLNAP